MSGRPIGIVLIIAGSLLLVLGLLVYLGLFSWFGRLPGDIRVENERVRFYFPITSMILISIAISLLLGLWRRLF